MPNLTSLNQPTRKPGFSIKTAKDLLNLPVHEVEERNVRRNENEYAPPMNQCQRKLQEIWEGVLKIKNIGIKDAFAHLGGNSLDATSIVSKIHKEFNVKVQLSEIFELSTLERLSLYIEGAIEKDYAPIRSLELKEYYDVSYPQKRLWLVEHLEEEQGAYNISDSFILEGLNPGAFEKALQGLVKRHEILRTTFLKTSWEPKQKIHHHDSFPYKIKTVDLSTGKVEPGEEEIKELIKEEAFASFDLEKGPLLRTTLFHLRDDRYIFVFAMHHIISDGWSIGTAMKDVVTLYNAYIEGREDPLTPLRIQSKDFAAWQNRQLTAEKLKSYQDYWRSRLGGEIPVLNLKTDYPRPAVKSQNGNKGWCILDKQTTEALKGISRKNEGSLFMTLFAAVYALLYYYTGQGDIIIGFPVSGRDHGDLENQIGLFLNMLSLRVKFSGNERFTSLLKKVKEAALSAYKNQAYPFDLMISDLNIERDVSRSLLFDVTVQLLNFNIGVEGGVAMKGVSLTRYDLGQVKCKYDIQVNFTEGNENIITVFEYNSDLFKHESIMRMMERFQKLIRRITANPSLQISSLSIEEEKPKLPALQPISRRI